MFTLLQIKYTYTYIQSRHFTENNEFYSKKKHEQPFSTVK